MDTAPQFDPDHRGAYDPAVSVADASGASPAPAPPHLLWETLESAYAAPTDSPGEPGERRLARYIALPVVLGLSLVLWVIIVELMLAR